MKDTKPIFFAFDNNYVEPAAIAFYSLLNKAKENVFYEMYVLHSDIEEHRQKILFDIVEKHKNANLTFINTSDKFKDMWNNGSFNTTFSFSTFTADTITRCFAANFFPQYDKIIYSDVDIIIVDDISEIYDIDIRDKYLAGVKNPFLKFSKEELSHYKKEHFELVKDKHFAGGIWVMNLKKIRNDKLENKMLNIIQDKTIEKRFPDQDIMNIACEGKVGFIPLNYISYPYMIDLLQNPDFISDYTKEELYDSIINPKIIHFAAEKPWNNNPKYSNLWWTYFNYLNLEKSKIFKEVVSPEKRKLKKYKKLFLIFLIISIFFALISVVMLLTELS